MVKLASLPAANILQKLAVRSLVPDKLQQRRDETLQVLFFGILILFFDFASDLLVLSIYGFHGLCWFFPVTMQ